MSENESAGEKTEQPTEKRLREAREQGNLPRSRELGTAAVFGGGVLAVMAMGGSIGRGATLWMKQALSPEQGLRQNPKELFGHFGDLLLPFVEKLCASSANVPFEEQRAHMPPELYGACITANGKMTPNFKLDRTKPKYIYIKSNSKYF